MPQLVRVRVAPPRLRCEAVVKPPVRVDDNLQLVYETGNAYYGVAGDHIVKAAVSANIDVDPIETDAISCAVFRELRRVPDLRSACSLMMTHIGTFVAHLDTRRALLRTVPPSPMRATTVPCKCVVTRFVRGPSLYTMLDAATTRDMHGIVAALSKTLKSMLMLGRATGFVHNDAHSGNLIYDPRRRAFVLIDYGRSSFNELWLRRVLGPGVMSRVVYEQCCALGINNAPSRLGAFYQQFPGFERKVPDTVRGHRVTRRLAIMNDIASIAFMAWFMVRVVKRWPGPEADAGGVVDVTDDFSSIRIPAAPALIVQRALGLKRSRDALAPLAPALAWMSMYLLSYFQLVAPDMPRRAAAPQEVSFKISSILGNAPDATPLWRSGQTTLRGVKLAELTMLQNLESSKFIATLMTKP